MTFYPSSVAFRVINIPRTTTIGASKCTSPIIKASLRIYVKSGTSYSGSTVSVIEKHQSAATNAAKRRIGLECVVEIVVVNFQRPTSPDLRFSSVDSNHTVVTMVVPEYESSPRSAISDLLLSGIVGVDIIIFHKKEVRTAPVCRQRPRRVAGGRRAAHISILKIEGLRVAGFRNVVIRYSVNFAPNVDILILMIHCHKMTVIHPH